LKKSLEFGGRIRLTVRKIHGVARVEERVGKRGHEIVLDAGGVLLFPLSFGRAAPEVARICAQSPPAYLVSFSVDFRVHSGQQAVIKQRILLVVIDKVKSDGHPWGRATHAEVKPLNVACNALGTPTWLVTTFTND
jgi:hypothetical protein